MSTKKLTTIGVLCAMALALTMTLRFPMLPTVSFLKYDPKDVVIVVGGFIYGPMSALLMSAICSGLEIMFRGGNILDMLMNMISTCSFACTAAYIYKHNRTKKGAVTGLFAGVIATTVSMALWNYIITPIYLHIPRDVVASMLLPGYIPFNLLKSSINAGLTLFLYKPLVGILRHTRLVEKGDGHTHESKGMLILGGFVVMTALCIVLAFNGTI